MENFLEEINADINWRMGQLATIKTLPYKYGMSLEHQEFLIKYLVPSCYAIWEGFIKNSFEIYTRQLNSLGMGLDEFSINIIVHSLERKYPQIKSEIKDQRKIEEFFDDLFYFTKNDFSISSKLPTESNVNLKVTNNILRRFNLDLIPEAPYKGKLNKLLKYRNSIAHGDGNIPVSKKVIEEFSKTINELICDIFIRIETGYKNNTYRANQ